MGFLLLLLAFISPRLVLFLLWAFTSRITIAFESGAVALLGFLFLPWTTLLYALAYAPFGGVTGFGWVMVGIGLITDLGSFASAKYRRAAY